MRLILLSAFCIVNGALYCMDDDFYSTGRNFLVSSGSHAKPKVSNVIAAHQSAKNCVFDYDKAHLYDQLSAYQTAVSPVSPIFRRTQSSDNQRVYGCEVPLVTSGPQRPTSPVMQQGILYKTVDHPLISSGGLMPE